MVFNLNFAPTTPTPTPGESMKITKQSQTKKSKADQVYDWISYCQAHPTFQCVNNKIIQCIDARSEQAEMVIIKSCSREPTISTGVVLCP